MRALRWAVTVAALSLALLLSLLAARKLAGAEGFDPYRIDYDRPGVDITTEGP